MGGASAKHAPAVTPIITEDSNPLSDRGRHLPSPPLQAQATITREDLPGSWAEQAPTMHHQSSLKTRTFCPTMQPSCALTTDTTISPPPPPITDTGMKISPLPPKDSNLSPGNGIQPVPSQAKNLTPHPTPLPFQLEVQSNVTLTPTLYK